MTTAAANTANEDDDDDSCQCQQAGRQQQLPAATNTDNNVNSCQCQCFLQSVPHPLPRSKCETEGYILFNFLQPVLIPFLARNTRWGGGFYILFYFIFIFTWRDFHHFSHHTIFHLFSPSSHLGIYKYLIWQESSHFVLFGHPVR